MDYDHEAAERLSLAKLEREIGRRLFKRIPIATLRKPRLKGRLMGSTSTEALRVG